MEAQAFQPARELAPALVGQVVTQGSVLQATNVELASGENLYQWLIFFPEEIVTPIGVLVLDHGSRQLAPFPGPDARIGEGGDELAVVRGTRHR
jgi:hypothetical protein